MVNNNKIIKEQIDCNSVSSIELLNLNFDSDSDNGVLKKNINKSENIYRYKDNKNNKFLNNKRKAIVLNSTITKELNKIIIKVELSNLIKTYNNYNDNNNIFDFLYLFINIKKVSFLLNNNNKNFFKILLGSIIYNECNLFTNKEYNIYRINENPENDKNLTSIYNQKLLINCCLDSNLTEILNIMNKLNIRKFVLNKLSYELSNYKNKNYNISIVLSNFNITSSINFDFKSFNLNKNAIVTSKIKNKKINSYTINCIYSNIMELRKYKYYFINNNINYNDCKNNFIISNIIKEFSIYIINNIIENCRGSNIYVINLDNATNNLFSCYDTLSFSSIENCADQNILFDSNYLTYNEYIEFFIKNNFNNISFLNNLFSRNIFLKLIYCIAINNLPYNKYNLYKDYVMFFVSCIDFYCKNKSEEDKLIIILPNKSNVVYNEIIDFIINYNIFDYNELSLNIELLNIIVNNDCKSNKVNNFMKNQYFINNLAYNFNIKLKYNYISTICNNIFNRILSTETINLYYMSQNIHSQIFDSINNIQDIETYNRIINNSFILHSNNIHSIDVNFNNNNSIINNHINNYTKFNRYKSFIAIAYLSKLENSLEKYSSNFLTYCCFVNNKFIFLGYNDNYFKNLLQYINKTNNKIILQVLEYNYFALNNSNFTFNILLNKFFKNVVEQYMFIINFIDNQKNIIKTLNDFSNIKILSCDIIDNTNNNKKNMSKEKHIINSINSSKYLKLGLNDSYISFNNVKLLN